MSPLVAAGRSMTSASSGSSIDTSPSVFGILTLSSTDCDRDGDRRDRDLETSFFTGDRDRDLFTDGERRFGDCERGVCRALTLPPMGCGRRILGRDRLSEFDGRLRGDAFLGRLGNDSRDRSLSSLRGDFSSRLGGGGHLYGHLASAISHFFDRRCGEGNGHLYDHPDEAIAHLSGHHHDEATCLLFDRRGEATARLFDHHHDSATAHLYLCHRFHVVAIATHVEVTGHPFEHLCEAIAPWVEATAHLSDPRVEETAPDVEATAHLFDPHVQETVHLCDFRYVVMGHLGVAIDYHSEAMATEQCGEEIAHHGEVVETCPSDLRHVAVIAQQVEVEENGPCDLLHDAAIDHHVEVEETDPSDCLRDAVTAHHGEEIGHYHGEETSFHHVENAHFVCHHHGATTGPRDEEIDHLFDH
eukprot:CAMPEP_0169082698 /NCGR_PEP_ID=MMETSP1015-20121227/11685_1 /TAXON_ID=342587 /ORGANISM="Karlodinium micrum, Strain CCMP2283" /LENGTH=414 /DNA_ID=CAMNT_0009142575 /DNA_START=285 /DNA_END=1527 /DNA_ORIENTATION=+